ncbi:unnamed protein product [Closterium sp. NIES-65]|nr:unnamed protein product [Closterium sp. NIES-65]
MSLAAASARRHVRWQAMLLQSQLIAQRSILCRPTLDRSQPFATSLDRAHDHPVHGIPFVSPKPPVSPPFPPPHAPLASTVAVSSLQDHSPAEYDIALLKNRRLSISSANVFPTAVAGQAMPDRQALPASRQVVPHHVRAVQVVIPQLTSARPLSGRSEGEAPVTWASLALLLLTGGALLTYFESEKRKRLEVGRRPYKAFYPPPPCPIPFPSAAVRELKPVGKAAIGGPFTLVDGNGKAFTEADLKGRWALLYFGFTFCPDICPSQLINIAQAVDLVEKQVGVKVVPVFISVDPERDTADQVKEYVKDTTEQVKEVRTFTPRHVHPSARSPLGTFTPLHVHPSARSPLCTFTPLHVHPSARSPLCTFTPLHVHPSARSPLCTFTPRHVHPSARSPLCTFTPLHVHPSARSPLCTFTLLHLLETTCTSLHLLQCFSFLYSHHSSCSCLAPIAPLAPLLIHPTAEFHPRMIGLTGTPEQVKAAARAFRVYYMKTEEEGYDYLVDHSIISYLMSPEFEFVKFFGRNHTPEGLADGIAGEIKGHGK